MSQPLYTAMATSTGDGRAGGRAASNDGLLDVTLAVPHEMGGPGGATNPEQGGFSLSAALHAEFGGIDEATADALVAAAHTICPYSNATRGNIPGTVDATVA
ncbi:organic hydroperoxide resistance protein [Kribbella flavida DSM 17836]|uniref:Organic hydroperoxide resistance protein n=1 Tax=Kribbella flavida (strain DSM 17836 / JCM 10339 / NBRC 14399) TaxID=479435 RepID=D2Q2M6_KRIFD|nr:organic hydroperoxide resistance protein [Kribbella flavida]ADB30207.1 organic hydroperoxide resistance protein [Kribbella flavida DSM 17836]